MRKLDRGEVVEAIVKLKHARRSTDLIDKGQPLHLRIVSQVKDVITVHGLEGMTRRYEDRRHAESGFKQNLVHLSSLLIFDLTK